MAFSSFAKLPCVIAVLLGFSIGVAAQQSGVPGAISSITVVRPNIVVRGTTLDRVEIWAIPTGTDVEPQQYQLLGSARLTSGGNHNQVWKFPIPPKPAGYSEWLAADIFAKGYDSKGKVIGQKSLTADGVTEIANALWGQN